MGLLPPLLLLIPFLLVRAPGRAEACSKFHESIFELAHSASRVAVARVENGGFGFGTLRVLRGLKGVAKGKLLTPGKANTSCGVRYNKGRRVLVFVTKKGWLAGSYEGLIEAKDHKGEFKDATKTLLVFLRARGPADQLKVLRNAIETSGDWVRYEALYFLQGSPDLLRLMTDADLQVIEANLHRARHATTAAQLLARLGNEQSLIRVKKAAASSREAAQAYQGVEKLFASSLALRQLTDTDKLATMVGDASIPIHTRIAALSRCELSHGKSLFRFAGYVGGLAEHVWPKLALACRRGKPHRW